MIPNAFLESESHQGITEMSLYSLEELIDVVCKVLNKPTSVVQLSGKERQGTQMRALIAFFIRASPHLTLKEFASFANRDISAISKLAINFELKLKNDERLAVDEINKCIKNIQIAKTQVPICDPDSILLIDKRVIGDFYH